jgi:hypothetical protein
MCPAQAFCDFALFKEKHRGHHIHRIVVTQLCFVVNLDAKAFLLVALSVFLEYLQEPLGKRTLRSIEKNEFLAFGFQYLIEVVFNIYFTHYAPFPQFLLRDNGCCHRKAYFWTCHSDKE